MAFWRQLLLVGWLAPLLLAAAERTHGGYFTAERLAHAEANVARLAWARDLREAAVRRAAPWREKSDEELWAMVPGQDLPRCIDVTLTRGPKGTTRAGCLVCGDAIDRFGNFPYAPDFEHAPWKLKCPSCGTVFPTNDFGAFYRSGIDARGLFDPRRADRRLLFNSEHPDPSDPKHLWGVDDGFGFVDERGQGHRYIGCYTWSYWRWLLDGLRALAEAYVYSGEKIYAHKAAVLIDRVADVYPDMDWKPYAERGWFHSDANRGVGKIEGAIWETNLARKLAEDYDAILSGTVDDADLFRFLARQAKKFQLPTAKGSREDFVRAADERLLRTIFRAVLSGQIGGNEGMQQSAVAACALALNTNPESSDWLDWLFAPAGGAIPGLVLGHFDRDGGTDEAAPNYAPFAGQLFSRIAVRLEGFPLYRKHDLFRDFPPLRATFTFAPRLAVLGRAVPNLGDTGATGLVTTDPASAEFCAVGFRAFRDPEMAVAAFRLNGNSGRGLGRDIFSEDPESLGEEIDRLGQAAGPRPVQGEPMTGYGLVRLEVGRDPATGFAVAMNYGRTVHHGHADVLNFDFFGFDHWLAPDQGYPEFATRWPSRDEWTVNTLAHNTVFVDGRPQERGWGGKLRQFFQTDGFAFASVEGRPAYPGLKKYERTLALVTTPDRRSAYVIDVFRVSGGRDHVYSFHGLPGEISTGQLQLVPQKRGTYAGETVAAGASPGDFPVGYSYLHDVRRQQSPPEAFTVDWRGDPDYRGLKRDDVHLRLHALTAVDDVALAQGDPPQNKVGNPRHLDYLLLHRAGQTLDSTFVAAIEAYRGTPAIANATRLPGGKAGELALRIELAGGAVDYFFWSENPSGPFSAAGISLSGRAAFLRYEHGKLRRATAVAATVLMADGVSLRSPGEWRGKVTGMNRELAGGGWLTVNVPLPDDGSLIGRQIHVANGNERDACYTIRAVERKGAGSRVDCGPIAFVRGYAGPVAKVRSEPVAANYEAGYLYDFEVGADFRIPLAVEWRAASGEVSGGN